MYLDIHTWLYFPVFLQCFMSGFAGFDEIISQHNWGPSHLGSGPLL